MDLDLSRNIVVEVIKKREKFLMSVTRHALSNHRPAEHVERHEQRRGTVAVIVMRHSFEVPGPIGSTG